MNKTLRALLLAGLALAFAAVLAVSAGAEDIVASGECGKYGDNLTWTLYASGVLEISGEGEMEDYAWGGGAPWNEYVGYYQDYRNNEPKEGYYYDLGLIFNEGITSIGSFAFYNLAFGGNLTIPDSVKIVGNGAFCNCALFSSLKLGNSLTTIGNCAFGCDEVCYWNYTGDLVIPDSVIDIGDYAFTGSWWDGRLSIGSNVRRIGMSAFWSGFTHIEVSDSNPGYSSMDGMLFNKDKTVLKLCPVGATITIPASVKVVEEEAMDFYDPSLYCSPLEEVCFLGDAPECVNRKGEPLENWAAVFSWDYNVKENLVISYYEGRSGWTTPTWQGYNTVPLHTLVHVEATEPVVCENGWKEHYRCIYCDRLFLDDDPRGSREVSEEDMLIPGSSHDYRLTAWEWSEDHSSAEAVFVCSRNESHVARAAAEVTSETTAPTCTEDGITRWSATVIFEGNEYTDSREKAIPATGHDYRFSAWEWAEDDTAAEAVFTCANDASHVLRIGAEVTAETTEPTCTEDGETVRTACAVFEDKEYTDERVEVLPALGHDLRLLGWLWAEDCSTAAAVISCGRDPSHVWTPFATVTAETKEPTCTEDGSKVWTAAVVFDEKEYSDTKEETVPATGHRWGEPVWEWAEDYSSAEAVFTCEADASHVRRVGAEITSDVTAVSCESDGSKVWTAAVVFEEKEYTDTKEETVPAAGHRWGEPVWEWAEDHSSAEAVFTCEADVSHVRRVGAEIASEVTAASCESDGGKVWTATVVFEEKEYTDTQEETVPASGHRWGEPVWEWAEDHSSAEAVFTCENDATHTRRAEATVTAVAVDPTETTPGMTVYIALAAFEGEIYTGRTEVPLPVPAPRPGDVNGDGAVTVLDRLILTRWLAGWTGYDEIIRLDAADINGDGLVSALDRLILSRHLAEWPDYARWFTE